MNSSSQEKKLSTPLANKPALKPLDCAILSHDPQGTGIEKHPSVILFVKPRDEGNIYVVAWGTTSAPATTETRKNILVRAGTNEARDFGLCDDTYFYDNHAVPALESALKRTGKRCSNGLYKRIKVLVEDKLKRVGLQG